MSARPAWHGRASVRGRGNDRPQAQFDPLVAVEVEPLLAVGELEAPDVEPFPEVAVDPEPESVVSELPGVGVLLGELPDVAVDPLPAEGLGLLEAVEPEPFPDPESSWAEYDALGESRPSCWGRGLFFVCELLTRSRTTLSVPWPRVTMLITPAVMATATSALATATTIAMTPLRCLALSLCDERALR